MDVPKVPTINVQTVFTAVVMSVVVGAAWFGIRYAASKAGPAISGPVEKIAAVAK